MGAGSAHPRCSPHSFSTCRPPAPVLQARNLWAYKMHLQAVLRLRSQKQLGLAVSYGLWAAQQGATRTLNYLLQVTCLRPARSQLASAPAALL